MSNEQTTVLLTHYPTNKCPRPRKIKLGTIGEREKQDFIAGFNKRIPTSLRWPCTFNIHYDKFVIHVRGFDNCTRYIPVRSQNKKREIIIEVIPRIDDIEDCCMDNCSVSSETACPGHIRAGGCPEYLITEYIGKTFLKDKYTQKVK